MAIDRRRALALIGLAALPARAGAETPLAEVRFEHGVASGDPAADGVVLWTRVTPVKGTPAKVSVAWEMATEPGFKVPVARGTAVTGADRESVV